MLVILLHGVGSNGADLMGLAQMWAPALPGVIFESPDAPHAFDHGPGYQWFSITGVFYTACYRLCIGQGG